LSGEGQYLAPNLISSTDPNVTFLNYNSRVTFLFPSKPFNIEVAAEYFSDSATPSASTFGYEDLSGLRYVAIVNIFVPKWAFNINLYYPFTVPTDSAQEYKFTFEYFFGLDGKAADNVLLSSGTIFEFRYVYKKIHNSQVTDPIDIRVRTMTASFGIKF
jgi:hypothetical protein